MLTPKLNKLAHSRTRQVFVLFSFYFCLSCGSNYPDPRAIVINNKASNGFSKSKLEDISTDELQSKYLKALSYEPFQNEILLNLGVTFELSKQPEKGIQLYKKVETDLENKISNNSIINEQDAKLFFVSVFNQAQNLGREKKVDEALSYYQKSLGVNPTSVEAKTNIELLMNQNSKGQGKGEGDSKDSKDENQDKQGQGQNKDSKDQKDKKDSDKEGDEEKKQNQKKDYASSPKYKPREFKGELNKESVQKIFGEISQQEKKMRTNFSKQNQSKESPREKDW